MTETVARKPTVEPPAPFTGASYTYDGDDNMVKSVINGITTYYASSSYVVEVDGSDTTVRKTYSAGSTSLAVRTIVNGTTETLNWLLSDHLGSSSITTMADGTWNSEIRYSAFGETRYSLGITPTDYRYTGQLQQKDVNLYYYNARYYDAALGRFVQADSIVPYPISSKSYDRYAYVSNNPIIYIDPSGHCYTDSGAWIPDGLGGSCIFKTSNQVKNTTQQLGSLGITVDGNDKQKQDVLKAAKYEMNKLRSQADNNPSFQSSHGEIDIKFGATTDIDGKEFAGNCIFNQGTLSCKNDLTMTNAIHEFGHAFDFTNFNSMGKKPSDYVPDAFLDSEDKGYLCTNIECIAHPSTMDEGWKYDDELKGIRRMEDFANMYQNWILSGDLNYPQSGFDSSTDEGVYRYSFMSARGNN